MAVVWEVVRSTALGGIERWTLLREFDESLGLGLETARIGVPELDERVDRLIRERNEARTRKDFSRSDEIRDQLLAEGIVLEDGPEGTRWRRA